MPLINPSNVTLGDIAANPYFEFTRDWIAFDLVIKSGLIELYAPKSSFISSFDTTTPPSSSITAIFPYIYSQKDDSAVKSSGTDLIRNGYGSSDGYFQAGSINPALTPNVPFWYFACYNLAGKNLAITKQSFHLNLIENASLAINPAGDNRLSNPDVLTGQSNYPGMTIGHQLHSGGYWEDNSIIKIPDYPEELIYMGAEFKIMTPLINGIPANHNADISNLNLELSVYAEVREIIGA